MKVLSLMPVPVEHYIELHTIGKFKTFSSYHSATFFLNYRSFCDSWNITFLLDGRGSTPWVRRRSLS